MHVLAPDGLPPPPRRRSGRWLLPASGAPVSESVLRASETATMACSATHVPNGDESMTLSVRRVCDMRIFIP